jgi:dimeric dUTPase (all-alpha-NTP-PPase superfamily)
MLNDRFLINAADLSEMVIAQESLNIKYNGENWRRETSMGKFKFAMLCEVAEFLDEITSQWKWYAKVGLTHNHNKATFELVDIIHFAISLTLYRRSPESINNEIIFVNQPNMFGPVYDQQNQFAKALTAFMRSVDNENLEGIVTHLFNIIQTGGELLELKPGVIKTAYDIKNMRNQERVAGGVMVGMYDKSKENELTL